ncbi:MAG: AAA family ATPase [Acidimicrobiia bacterium]|nr:AAA family ATPase [Acidimicrobiia bacterium]
MALGTEHASDKSILLVSGDQKFIDGTRRYLNGHKVFTARNVTDAQRRLVEESVHLAILDPAFATESGVSEGGQLLQVDPSLPLVLVAANPDMAVLRTALRVGYKDVIDAPVDRQKMEAMLGLIEEEADRVVRKEAKTQIGRVVTIMSPKGGAGKTVTAANVGLQLAMWSEPDRVVIMDCDLQFGDIALVMQVDPVHTIVDAARELDDLDEDLMRSLLTSHPSGLKILAAPLEPSLADEVSTQSVVRSIAMLKRMFDYVVIDTAPFLDEPVLSILERSDDVLLVVDMDLPSVKNAKLALDTLKLIKFPFEKIQLVLNRVNSKARLDIGELERSLELDVQAAISSDKLVPRAVNEGEPVVSLYPRSRVAKDLRAVTRLVVDESVTPNTGEGEGSRKWFK